MLLSFDSPLFANKTHLYSLLQYFSLLKTFEVCNLTKSENYNYVFDKKTRSAYIYGGDRQWLGLENPITMFSKASYIKAHNLAGIMIYDLASDDYKVLFVI